MNEDRKSCPDHPFSGEYLVIEPPSSPHYGRLVCPKCGKFLNWAKAPEGVKKKKPSRSFHLGGVTFDTKTAIVDYVKTTLSTCSTPTPLDGEQFNIIRDLINFHPEADSKIGCGISRIEIRSNYEFGGNAKGFWLIRDDGSETDFSYKKCLDGEKAHHNKFIRACRFAIKDYTEEFKREFFSVAVRPTCALTGEAIAPDSCHVDHIPPCTFDRIVQAFVALYQLNTEDPELCMNGVDGLVVPTFASDLLREKFIRFHNTFAQLRCISAHANVSLVTQFIK